MAETPTKTQLEAWLPKWREAVRIEESSDAPYETHEGTVRGLGEDFGTLLAAYDALSSELQEARAELERVRKQLADALGTIRNLTTPRAPACSHRTVNSCGECWDCGAIV